jgi:hypothetical protein
MSICGADAIRRCFTASANARRNPASSRLRQIARARAEVSDAVSPERPPYRKRAARHAARRMRLYTIYAYQRGIWLDVPSRMEGPADAGRHFSLNDLTLLSKDSESNLSNSAMIVTASATTAGQCVTNVVGYRARFKCSTSTASSRARPKLSFAHAALHFTAEPRA